MRSPARFRLFPMPMHSLLLFVVWLLLNNTVALGHIIFFQCSGCQFGRRVGGIASHRSSHSVVA